MRNCQEWAIRLFILIKSNFHYLFSVRFECARQANRIRKINCERELTSTEREKKTLSAFASIYHRHQLYLFQLLKRKNRLASMEQFYLSFEIRVEVALLCHTFSCIVFARHLFFSGHPDYVSCTSVFALNRVSGFPLVCAWKNCPCVKTSDSSYTHRK